MALLRSVIALLVLCVVSNLADTSIIAHKKIISNFVAAENDLVVNINVYNIGDR
jgi:hypothetical protein